MLIRFMLGIRKFSSFRGFPNFLFVFLFNMNKIIIIEIDMIIYQIKFNNKIKSKFIMKITKQNETFNLSDTTDVFEMNGSVSYEVTGTLNLHIHVNKVGGENVGDCHYNRYGESSNVNFGLNCSEENRDAFAAYADTIIDSVLEHFSLIN